MEQTSLRPRLERRLTVLATRIAELRHKMCAATGLARLEEFGEIDQLEGRYDALETRLRRLDHEGVGRLPALKAEIETMAADLAGTLDDCILRIDSGFRLCPVRKQPNEK